VGFELLTQLDDVSVHSAGIRERLIAPDGIKNHIASERTVRVRKKIRQQVVFGGRELQWIVGARDHAALEVDHDIAKLRDFPRVGRSSPKDGADTSQQFARAERLYNIVVRADFEQQDFVDLLADCAQYDDRRVDVSGAKLFGDLNSAHAGQPEID